MLTYAGYAILMLLAVGSLYSTCMYIKLDRAAVRAEQEDERRAAAKI